MADYCKNIYAILFFIFLNIEVSFTQHKVKPGRMESMESQFHLYMAHVLQPVETRTDSLKMCFKSLCMVSQEFRINTFLLRFCLGSVPVLCYHISLQLFKSI